MSTILIADDNEQNLYMLRLVLEKYEHEVISAANGFEALELARRHPPDMIISDVLMPVMDGFTLCWQCKVDPQLHDVPFVFYTAEYTNYKDQELARNLGVKGFILKPAEPDELIQILNEVLAGKSRPAPQLSASAAAEADIFFRDYNEALIRKLEEKMTQIADANRRSMGLQEACAAMTSSLGLDEVLQRIARGAVEALHSNAVWILVVDEAAGTLESKVLIGVRDGHVLALEDALALKSSTIPITDFSRPNWLTDALLAKESIVLPDIAEAESDGGLPDTLLALAKLIDFRSLVIMPMLQKDNRAIGLMALARILPGQIPDGEMRLITAFAHQAAIAIENAQLFDEVERSERRYRTLLESSADAIVSLDDALNITAWNTGAEQIFGYASADIIGQAMSVLFPEALRVDFAEAMEKVHRRGVLRGWKTRQRCQTGRLIDVEMTLTDLGSEWGYTAILTDITERLAKEAQLLQAQKMEALGQLVGGIAHDFNNLLTIVLGNLKFLGQDLAASADDNIRELLADALSAGEDGAQLTRRLLAFSRRQTLITRRIDINALITDFARLLSRTLGAGVDLRIEAEAPNSEALVDSSQLESALLNLCINARDAMPGGGVLSIRTRQRTIGHGENGDSERLAPGDYIAITVSDTGTGMNTDTLAHACEPFFTTKQAGKGSGLGLSLVYGFVEQSGGSMAIDSEPGQGTAITLLLPEARDEDEEQNERQNMGELPHGTESILLVEDETRIRRFANRCLHELGYRVLESENAAEAMTILRTGAPVDLVFSDIMMPGTMNGRGLARWVTEHHPGIKVLLTTSYNQIAAEQARAAEQFTVLAKPYAKAELAERLRVLLDQPA